MKRNWFICFTIMGLLQSSTDCTRPICYDKRIWTEICTIKWEWDVIIDPYLHGHKDSIYKDKPLKSKSDFKEYAFEGGVRLNVPGDWNSQYPELKYYEGTVWYARHFSIKRSSDENVFLYFGAVNYQCTVYLNGTKVGEHEGGFTPFQINITDYIVSGDNFLVLEVNNYRNKDAIPALLYDWWNYGGITRNVMIVKTPQLYIDHYLYS